MSGGEINFTIRANNENFLRALREAQTAVDQTVDAVESGGKDIDSVLSKLGQLTSMFGIGFGVKEFVSQMVKVRSEFQAADTAIQTLLGSKEKADELMSKVREFAQISPLEFSDVTQATQMMLGFNIEAEKIPRFLQAIGDVSMGNTNQFNSLTLAFSQMSATGKLMGQDLNQMINAGFNPLQQMAKTTGKSISELKDEMSKGAISAEMVQQAFVDATSAGGQFYQMSENASKTIQGQISMLEDAMAAAFNEIGKQSEGLIMKGITGATTLVENYEKIGAIVASLAATYGTYKTALIVVTIAEKAHATSLWSTIKATRAAAVAQAALNAVVKANPYVLMAAAVVGVATAIWALRDSSTAAEKAEKAHHKAIESVNTALEDRKKEAEDCIRVVQDETETITAQVTAYNKLKTLCPELTRLYDIEALSVLNLADAQKVLNAERDKSYKSSLVQGLNESTEKIQKLEKDLEKYEEASKVDYGFYNLKKAESTKKQLDEQIEIRKKYQEDLKKIEEAESQANAKTENKTSYKDAFNKAKAEYDVARKAVEEAKKGSSEDYTKAVADLEAKEKAFKDLGGTTYDKSSKTAEDLRKETDQYLALIDQQQLEMQRGKEDLWNQVRNAEISAMKDGSAKTLAEMEQQYKERKQAINRQQEDLLRSRVSDAKAAFEANPSNKGKSFDGSGISLTANENEQFKALFESAETEYNNRLEAFNTQRQEAERTTIQEYLKSYGEYEEKRLAIAQEAEDKIKKIREDENLTDTQKEYKIKNVNAGAQKELNDLQFDELKKSIDWDTIFGDLDTKMPEVIEAVKEQLQQFIDTANGLQPDQIKTVVEAMTQLQDKMDLSKPIESIKKAQQEYAKAKTEYDKYKEAYDKANASGDTQAANEAQKGMIKSSGKMSDAQKKEKKAFEAVTGIVADYADALSKAGDIIGGTSGDLLKLAASAISAGVGMANGINQFKAAVDNMQRSIAILAIIQAAYQVIQAIVSIFGDSADKTLTDYVETLDTYIDALSDRISDLNDAMSDTKNTIAETIGYYKELKQLTKESATAIKSQSQTWLQSGASKGFLGIGSSSSEGVKIRKQIEEDLKSTNLQVRTFYQQGYRSLNEYFKKATGAYAKSVSDFGRMDFIWKLSDDDLMKLAEDTQAIALLGDTLGEAVTNYAEKLKAVQDNENSLGEALLSVSWDDFYDDFVDMISDMDNDSENFAQDFAEYMRTALIKNLVAEKYKTQLNNLYGNAVKWMQQGTLEDHIEELRKEYQQYAEAAQKEAQTIDSIVGYNSSSSDNNATSGGFQTMSQDSADELNGRFTALQMSGEEIKRTLAESAMYQYQLVSLTTDGSTTLNNILYQHVVTNAYLEDITAYTKKMAGFSSQLDKMNDKLDKL